MARPIEETPILRGKDARRFEKMIAHPIPASKEEREAARIAYEKFKAIATFKL